MFRRKSTQEEKQLLILYHGTSLVRAENINKEGFVARGGASRGIYFAQDPSIARSYARGRGKNERDKPAVIMVLIDIARYNHRNYGAIYSFQHDHLPKEIIFKIFGLGRMSSKLKDISFGPEISLDFHSSYAAIAYWISSSPALSGGEQIREDHPSVISAKQWLISQADSGRKGIVPDDVSLMDIILGVLPFVVIQALAMIIVIIFPQIAMWLPSKMML